MYLFLKYHCITHTFINVNLGADLNDCMMDAACSLDKWTGTLASATFDGAGIFNL